MRNLLVASVAAASLLLALPGVSTARGNGEHFSGGANGDGGYGGGYYGGGYYGGGYYGGGYYGGGYDGYNGGFADGFDGVLGGLALGAVLGGVLATQHPVGYCARTYRSYDPATGTYLGYDGLRHRC